MRKIKHYLYWAVLKLSRGSKLFRFLIDIAALCYYKLFRSAKTFVFNGVRYKYFYHYYNRTVASERVVEIPIAKKLLQEYKGKDVLEVGNVMAHYFDIEHDVLDKYEKAPGVINKDVVTFNPKKKYDLIFSISTLEHVGFSYGEKEDHGKFLRGVNNLKKFLYKGGLLFATFPAFLTPGIDKLLKANKMPFTKEIFMKRISYANDWKQVTKKEAMKEIRYDSHFANTNILYLGYFKKK